MVLREVTHHQEGFLARFSSVFIRIIYSYKSFEYVILLKKSGAGIAIGYKLDDREVGSSSPGRVKNFYFSMSSRLALGPTQPPI
jgi:hypothetical protein